MVEGRIVDADSPTTALALKSWIDPERSQPPASPFQRHDVTMALHAIHTPERHLACAIAGEADSVTSILPFSTTRRHLGPLPFRLIEAPVGYHASVVDFAVSGGEHSDHTAASALLASHGWDLLEFRGVQADSALARAFAVTHCTVVDDHDAHAIPLNDGDAMSAKRARNLRRLRRRMLEETGTEIGCSTPADPEWRGVLEAFTTWHVARWRGTATPSALEDPGTHARLMAQLGDRSAPAGLRAVTLRDATRIRGVVLAWNHGTEVHAWRIAYDTALAPYSPGLQLLNALAESAASEGRTALRLGRGDDDYKQSWTTIRIPQVIVRGVNTSARVRLTGALARLAGRAPFAGWHG